MPPFMTIVFKDIKHFKRLLTIPWETSEMADSNHPFLS